MRSASDSAAADPTGTPRDAELPHDLPRFQYPAAPMSLGPGAYGLIKSAILDGELRPGDKLTENALAGRFAVSRTPIREALMRLEQEGLTVRSDRGLVVRERSVEEILDIYETRCVLEAMVARVAAERRTSHDMRMLDHCMEKSADVDTNAGLEMARYNREFHRVIWRAAHHETLADLLDRLDVHLGRYPETTLKFPGRWLESLAQHRMLVEAIRTGDGDEAAHIAYHHFITARDIRLTLSYGRP